MKGRTVQSVLRLVNEYQEEQRQIRLMKEKQLSTLQGMDYQEWNFCDDKGQWYAIFQL